MNGAQRHAVEELKEQLRRAENICNSITMEEIAVDTATTVTERIACRREANIAIQASLSQLMVIGDNITTLAKAFTILADKV